jgi:hypothetical protein
LHFLRVNFCTFCTTKGTAKVIRGKFFVGLFFTEKWVHWQFAANNSPQGNSPQRQFIAEAIHRRASSLHTNLPQRQFTARTIHRKQFTAKKFKVRQFTAVVGELM